MRSVLSGIISALSFLGLFVFMKFSLPMSILLSLAVYSGIYLISKPTVKIGNVAISDLDNGEEMMEAYEAGKKRIEKLGSLINGITDIKIKEKSRELHTIGWDVINYLKRKPEKIQSSLYFLNYYLSTANKIVENYIETKEGNISADKFQEMTELTTESIDLLITVFRNQRDSYYTDTLMETEVENEVLEKTIKMRGEFK